MSRICGFNILRKNYDPAKETVRKDLINAGVKLPVNEWLEMED
jgi:hypothetical protein